MFDTLSYSEELVNIGVPEKQAKLQAKVLSKALKSNDFATTKDIVRLEAKITVMDSKLTANMSETESKLTANMSKLESKLMTNMSKLETKLTANMSEMKFELIKWMIGMFFALTGVMFALFKFMLPLKDSIDIVN